MLEIRLTPIGEDGRSGVAAVIMDLTKERFLEEAHAADIQRAKAVETSFSRYLAPHVVKSLVRDPDSVKLGGERQRATMLFADIRGFTNLAATLPAEEVVELLNTYFDGAISAIFTHEGLLDKLYGDGLMAVFGPPRIREDDATRALAAARTLHATLERLAPRLSHPLRISIGLATGDVVAGHIGNKRRADYTVIGNAVNLAMGLQSAAPAGHIYCDQLTYELAGMPSDASRVSAQVKGRKLAIVAYDVALGLSIP